jgi:hypothetical protein
VPDFLFDHFEFVDFKLDLVVETGQLGVDHGDCDEAEESGEN